jgi:membrane dipeptidase
MADAAAVHAGAMVIDGTCPVEWWQENRDLWRRGGTSACVVTVAAWESCRDTVGLIAEMYRRIEADDGLVLATDAAHIRDAKRDGRLAVVLQFQGTHPLEYDANLAELYARLGVRVIQLTYNVRSPAGDGCEEPEDAGLSRFGRKLVAEFNRLGILVDVSHTGLRTSLEAVEASERPVVASHSNPAGVFEHRRNIPDHLIRAIAESGGLVGINGFGPFVDASARPTLDRFIDHAAYVAELVGPEHVGIGIDYTIPATVAQYENLVAEGHWSRESYPPPPWSYPTGIDDASMLPNLTARLLERGFAEDEVHGILGGNWLRVFEAAWR